jgi:uncharacterized protein YodC (DUF2158 family)
MSKELRIGDNVRLNSGSPNMKIIAVSVEDVHVQWDRKGALQQHTFPRVCVRKVA